MNLRVDLILPSEQRSGSIVSVKSLTRIATIALPSIILVFALIFGYQHMELRGQVKKLETAWKDSQPKEKHAREISAQLSRNKKILNEIQGWKNSNMDWHWLLLDLQEQVPENIALTQLKLSHSTKTIEGHAARSFNLHINARAEGMNAESSILKFQSALTGSKKLKEAVSSVAVVPGSYQEDTSTGNEYDRVFKIQCKFKPGTFK